MVPVKVSADGYENYTSSISIASNVTYLVEANVCKLVSTQWVRIFKKSAGKKTRVIK